MRYVFTLVSLLLYVLITSMQMLQSHSHNNVYNALLLPFDSEKLKPYFNL